MIIDRGWARHSVTGLLGKARALFHGLGPKGEYPSRVCGCRWCAYDRVFAKQIRWVLPWDRAFFEQLKEDWESAEHEGHRLERMLAGEE